MKYHLMILSYLLIFLDSEKFMNKCAGSEGPFANESPLSLLVNRREIQKDLDLTADQIDKIRLINKQTDKKEVPQEDTQLKLAEILRPEQAKRLKEIRWQVLDGRALTEPELAGLLHLSLAQKSQIDRVWKDQTQELNSALSRLRFKSEEDRKTFITKNLLETSDLLLKVLTSEQKQTFQKLKGKEFKSVDQTGK